MKKAISKQAQELVAARGEADLCADDPQGFL